MPTDLRNVGDDRPELTVECRDDGWHIAMQPGAGLDEQFEFAIRLDGSMDLFTGKPERFGTVNAHGFKKQPQATPELLEAARDLYARGSDDDIEVDDDAAISEAGDGTWVQMWGWVANRDDE